MGCDMGQILLVAEGVLASCPTSIDAGTRVHSMVSSAFNFPIVLCPEWVTRSQEDEAEYM